MEPWKPALNLSLLFAQDKERGCGQSLTGGEYLLSHFAINDISRRILLLKMFFLAGSAVVGMVGGDKEARGSVSN